MRDLELTACKHGQVLDKHKQDLCVLGPCVYTNILILPGPRIAKDLRDLYDWNAQTFVLENVREE